MRAGRSADTPERMEDDEESEYARREDAASEEDEAEVLAVAEDALLQRRGEPLRVEASLGRIARLRYDTMELRRRRWLLEPNDAVSGGEGMSLCALCGVLGTDDDGDDAAERCQRI